MLPTFVFMVYPSNNIFLFVFRKQAEYQEMLRQQIEENNRKKEKVQLLLFLLLYCFESPGHTSLSTIRCLCTSFLLLLLIAYENIVCRRKESRTRWKEGNWLSLCPLRGSKMAQKRTVLQVMWLFSLSNCIIYPLFSIFETAAEDCVVCVFDVVMHILTGFILLLV